jgi:zinc/manganese transport system substrate-binding protein
MSLIFDTVTSMSPLRRIVVVVPALLAVATSTTACGFSSEDSSSDDGGLSIVATTNVYGDIARAVAGDGVTVTSIITSPDQDPHEYEVTAQDRLAIARADVVIENGGGFDPFADTLLDAAGGDPVVLTAVELSGLSDHDGHDHVEGFNEHVWYDFEAVDQLAHRLADELAQLRPDDAEGFESRYATFAQQLHGLMSTAGDLRTSADGRDVAITEPVPLCLLESVGLVNVTPEEFSEAVEEGADVPPRALQETLDLFSSARVVLLAYNEQAEDATTQRVRAAAETAGIPVVDVTETLPVGETYVAWQRDNLERLARALG